MRYATDLKNPLPEHSEGRGFFVYSPTLACVAKPGFFFSLERSYSDLF